MWSHFMSVNLSIEKVVANSSAMRALLSDEAAASHPGELP